MFRCDGSRQAWLYPLLIISTIGATGAITGCKKSPASAAKANADATSSDELPEQDIAAWAELEPAQTLEVTVTAQGPSFKDRDFELVPTLWPTQHISEQLWKINTQGNVTTLEGSARYKTSFVDTSWKLAKGDPQTSWSFKVNRLPLHQLSEPIELEWILPKGKVTYIDEELRRKELADKAVTLHAWTPGWLRWSNGQRAITLAEWSFDHVRLTPLEDGKIKLTMSIWDPRQHPSITHCEVRGREGLTLDHRMSVVFGERQDVFASRLAQGFEAAMVPVFVDPRWHPDRTFHEGDAKDLEDMIHRAKTLLYGHSSSQDPRYGNGGLLGTGLGGTIVIAPEFVDKPELQKLASELTTTRAELAPYRVPKRADNTTGFGTFAGPSISCEAYLERREGADDQVLIEFKEPTDGSYHNALKPKVAMVIGDQERISLPPAITPDLPATMSVEHLSGRRQALTDQNLSKLYTQRLIRERGITWFASPLIGTRNPLVELAQDQLVDPERYGHWTLNPELSSALGQLELLQEGQHMTMLSARALNHYWRHARQVRLREQPDGSLMLHNAGPALSQFTLITHGATITTVDEAPIKDQKDLTSQSGEAQRWFWFDLKSGATRVSFQEGRDEQALKATLWRVNKL